MRHIHKGQEPGALAAWRGPVRGGETRTWDGLPPPVKDTVRQALLSEQYHLCCYCGGRVAAHNSHIEHFQPQRFQARRFDYDNLLLSCNGKDHCGAAKGKWFDERLLVSPLDPRCEEYFDFGSDGSIAPAAESPNAEAARQTIAHLGLARVTAHRRAAIKAYVAWADASDDLDDLLQFLDEPDAQGELTPYCFAVRQVLCGR